MHYYQDLYAIIDEATKTPQERYDTLNTFLRTKGYGDRENELGFFVSFFQKLFTQHYDLWSVEWNQYQDYNDNYLYFDLHGFQINDYLRLNTIFEGAMHWNYHFTPKEDYGQIPEERAAFFVRLQTDNQSLRPVVDKVLIFLKVLYDLYGPFYFIYLFGRRAKVRVDQAGITIDTEYVEFMEGNAYDRYTHL